MIKKYISAGLLMLTFGLGAMAQDFISVADLAKKVNNPKVQIISARDEADYKQVHIRNAINVPVKSLSDKEPIEGMLKSPQALAKVLGDKGVDPTKEIVLYCNKGNNAGRMYWIMKSMGFEDVKLLDGNLEAWKAARKPVTRAPKMAKKTTIPATFDNTYVASKTEVLAGGVVLLDVRSAAYYGGTDPKSKGHIPGAINIDSDALKTADGLLKPTAELEKMFADAGADKDQNIIVYCQTGTRGGLAFMVMTSVLGYSNVKLYDGSYNEWSADTAMKLEK